MVLYCRKRKWALGGRLRGAGCSASGAGWGDRPDHEPKMDTFTFRHIYRGRGAGMGLEPMAGRIRLWLSHDAMMPRGVTCSAEGSPIPSGSQNPGHCICSLNSHRAPVTSSYPVSSELGALYQAQLSGDKTRGHPGACTALGGAGRRVSPLLCFSSPLFAVEIRVCLGLT